MASGLTRFVLAVYNEGAWASATLGILLLGGMVAAYLPALRATRINPLEALKVRLVLA